MLNKSGKIIMFFNAITLLIGLIMIAAAAYVWVGFSKYDALISMTAIYAGLAGGIIITLVSLAGFYGAYADKRAILFLYLIFVALVFGLQIAAAVIFAQYQGQIAKTSSIPTDEIVDTFSISANNMMLSTYTTCCSGCGPNVCNVEPAVPEDGPFCSYNATEPAQCIYVYNCPVGEVCYVNSTSTTIPVFSIDVSVCTGLKQLAYVNGTKSSPIVGPFIGNDKDSCGKGDPLLFRTLLYGFANSVFDYSVIIFGVLAGVQGLILIAGIYIICFAKKSMKD